MRLVGLREGGDFRDVARLEDRRTHLIAAILAHGAAGEARLLAVFEAGAADLRPLLVHRVKQLAPDAAERYLQLRMHDAGWEGDLAHLVYTEWKEGVPRPRTRS